MEIIKTAVSDDSYNVC